MVLILPAFEGVSQSYPLPENVLLICVVAVWTFEDKPFNLSAKGAIPIQIDEST